MTALGSGTLALQGGGPFIANDELDRRLLDGVDRVVVLPTAEAYEQPREMVATAQAWGERIGVAVEPLMVLTRPDATEEAAAVIDRATAVVLAGDGSIHLRSVLKNTPVLEAVTRVLDRDGVVIGVGPSASALCDPMTDRRGGAFALGLGVMPGLAIVTEIEGWPRDQLERARTLANTPLVELSTGDAVVRSSAGWELVGSPTVHGELPTG